ncbi:MAG: serine protease [bacterium]|nr:serine protease [bacterium]
MGKNIFKILAVFILGIAGGIFGVQILWPYFVERPLFFQYRLEQNPVYITERKQITIQENTALKDAVEKVEKTVIGVRTRIAENGKILEGSGLIITSDGLIVTLADLVPQGSSFSFFAGGKPVSFQILKRDSESNLALVKIGETGLPTVGFAKPDTMKLGERVFLVGVVFKDLALATSTKISFAVNEGIVKSFDKNSIETNISEKENLAGSPLFNIEGEVLGLNTISLEGKIVAIPVSKIKNFIGF